MAENIRLLPIWDTISLAWNKTNGAKKTIWAAIIVMFLILFLLAIVIGTLEAIFLGTTLHSKETMILGNIFQLISYLFQMGILYIGIKRAFDYPINYRIMFTSFRFYTIAKLVGLYILQLIILLVLLAPFIAISLLLNALTTDMSKDFFSGIFLVASILISIYVFIRMSLAPCLIIDKQVNSWKAIKLSFQATRFNFWRLLIVTIIEILILIISIIPLGIGLIWTIPFIIICYGIIYKTLSANIFPEQS